MLKRAFDLTVAFLGLTFLSPLFITLAVAVKLNSPGPIFYRARRVGQYGKEFYLFKFRSMIANADKIGPGVTGSGDSRITSVGRFLRRTKLDELPQLVNVLRGDMSIVGPRPEDSRYVALYTASQKRVLDVRPGITSPASVKYRNEEAMLSGTDWETLYIQQIMPAKLAIDLEYADNPTIWRDVHIIAKTFLALFR
jgi:lipopolysaccharide/colanic/teichoic acid biosynthesis glycosyltransferase